MACWPLFFPLLTVFLLFQSEVGAKTQLSTKKIFGSENGPYFKFHQKWSKSRFFARWPLFFALLTVFLFHQIKHWVNIHLWTKRFFAPKGISMPKIFSKVPKMRFFLGFWPVDRCFSPCWPFFYSIKLNIEVIYIFGPNDFLLLRGHLCQLFLQKCQNCVFSSFWPVEHCFSPCWPVFISPNWTLG